MTHDKRILRELAKRWAKGVLLSAIGSEAFMDTDLKDDQIDVIWGEVGRIAERITDLEAATETDQLVDEYFHPAQ